MRTLDAEASLTLQNGDQSKRLARDFEYKPHLFSSLNASLAFHLRLKVLTSVHLHSVNLDMAG